MSGCMALLQHERTSKRTGLHNTKALVPSRRPPFLPSRHKQKLHRDARDAAKRGAQTLGKDAVCVGGFGGRSRGRVQGGSSLVSLSSSEDGDESWRTAVTEGYEAYGTAEVLTEHEAGAEEGARVSGGGGGTRGLARHPAQRERGSEWTTHEILSPTPPPSPSASAHDWASASVETVGGLARNRAPHGVKLPLARSSQPLAVSSGGN
ncbi:hypothetical protein B0H13DRAFT_1906814 [Mycena leptocephala]|nr:hypothetical protein B0H13DRAFT_1906814 [Mycena leptocephala]